MFLGNPVTGKSGKGSILHKEEGTFHFERTAPLLKNRSHKKYNGQTLIKSRRRRLLLLILRAQTIAWGAGP